MAALHPVLMRRPVTSCSHPVSHKNVQLIDGMVMRAQGSRKSAVAQAARGLPAASWAAPPPLPRKNQSRATCRRLPAAPA